MVACNVQDRVRTEAHDRGAAVREGGTMATTWLGFGTRRGSVEGSGRGVESHASLDADIIIANAPDPVFVSDLEGKILQANDAVSQLLGFRQDEVVEQSVSRFISLEETREFTAALREVVERGVTRNARLNPRSASGEVIPTTLNASALRDSDGMVIGAIGVLRDMREYEEVVRDLEQSKTELQEKILDLEKVDRKSVVKGERVELGGRRIIKDKEQSLSRFISAEE